MPGSRDATDTTLEEDMPAVWLRIQGTSGRPLSGRNKGWNQLVPRADVRNIMVWFREQGRGDEQCSSDTASHDSGYAGNAGASPTLQFNDRRSWIRYGPISPSAFGPGADAGRASSSNVAVSPSQSVSQSAM
ncbi:hypothetical protein KVR01_011326 [Diaporthe batatas]|uniref:uncharacterized protein n=1 Tax=Diaporthe batatas TaxID=748121 RepID=UPI001D040156|nr:uncharacterized protein KVR01_011326 [Diaporthe batatas]KAG8158883.1 hypothetical protein KVR01_011326 [Diaporthe batatas]